MVALRRFSKYGSQAGSYGLARCCTFVCRRIGIRRAENSQVGAGSPRRPATVPKKTHWRGSWGGEERCRPPRAFLWGGRLLAQCPTRRKTTPSAAAKIHLFH